MSAEALLTKGRDSAVAPVRVRPWWARADLGHNEHGRLIFAGVDVGARALEAGSPLYLYSPARARAKLEMVRAALSSHGVAHRVFYAMKANRHRPLLEQIRASGLCGVDVCSPNELLLAREVGFAEGDISYTGTSVSNGDLDVVARHPGIAFNCDSLSSLRRLGERCPGRTIGLRMNPALGIGYRTNELLRYSGTRITKFGLHATQLPEAFALARQYDLRIAGLHVHAGCGFLTEQLPVLRAILGAIRSFAGQFPPLDYINIGGGLGSPLVESDATLDLDAWAALVAQELVGLSREVWVEPGDFIVKDAGVLVLQVNTVERKADTLFVGVNGGFNLNPEPAFYALPCEPVACTLRDADGPTVRATIAGNINEALDLWGTDVTLPADVAEEDFIAFLNAGAYGASMSSNHCMRGTFVEQLI